MRFICRFRRFDEGFLSKREPCASPFFLHARASHNLGKALGEGLGLLCAPFTSLSLSPLSLILSLTPSLSLLSLPLSLYLSLSLYISPSTFLSLSLLLSLFSLSFSLAYLMDVFVLVTLSILYLFLYSRPKGSFYKI